MPERGGRAGRGGCHEGCAGSDAEEAKGVGLFVTAVMGRLLLPLGERGDDSGMLSRPCCIRHHSTRHISRVSPTSLSSAAGGHVRIQQSAAAAKTQRRLDQALRML